MLVIIFLHKWNSSIMSEKHKKPICRMPGIYIGINQNNIIKEPRNRVTSVDGVLSFMT